MPEFKKPAPLDAKCSSADCDNEPHCFKQLETTPDTVSRWNHGRAHPRPSKEKILMDLEYVVERLAEFYSDPRTARAWLYSRHKYFDGTRPADLIREGRVQEVLEAIQAMGSPACT